MAKTQFLTLRLTPLPFTPQQFYISDLVDEREDRQAVAYLVATNKNPALPAITQSVDLTGGGLHAIREFIWQGLARNMRLRPVEVRLQECRITETAGTAGRVNGRIVVAMAFYLQRNNHAVHLVNYRGGARYDRPASRLTSLEPTLRQSLTDALQFLNTWMNREAYRNEKLATGLQLSFTY
ncbi:MAG: hypothetical protein V4714_15165, partial [Bacteroidota bacterium]